MLVFVSLPKFMQVGFKCKKEKKDKKEIMMCDLEEEKDANLVLTHLASRKVHKRAAIKMQL